jgi:hypothetical protein
MDDFKVKPLITFEEEELPVQRPRYGGSIVIPDGESQSCLHRSADIRETFSLNGVTYQRCGGGRRVVRRRRAD